MKKPLLWILPVVVTALVLFLLLRSQSHPEDFARLMGADRGDLEKGDATNAVRFYSQAVQVAPESVDAHLNLDSAVRG